MAGQYRLLFDFLKSLGKFEQYKDYEDYSNRTDWGVASGQSTKVEIKPAPEKPEPENLFKDYFDKDKCSKRHQEWLTSLSSKEKEDFDKAFK